MGRTNITEEKRLEILTLRAEGLSYAAVAERAGVAKQTAVDECKRGEERLATMTALRLEEMYETLCVTKGERIKAHADTLNRIRAELERRDLADIPTDRLISLQMKVLASLREEIVEPRAQSSEEQETAAGERLEVETILAGVYKYDIGTENG